MRGIPFVLAAFCLAFLLACTTPATQSPVPSSGAPTVATTAPGASDPATESPIGSSAPTSQPQTSANFGDALAFVTAGTTLVSFDDWTQIKELLGASDVTSQSPEEDRMRVLIDGFMPARTQPGASPAPLSDLEHVAGGYGLESARVHAQNWGFDVLDYEWDATFSREGPPVSVVKLRDDLDMAPVIAHFDERDYATEEVAGATLRTHALDPSADWLAGELEIFNVAILDDGHTMILASNEEAVRDFLEADREQAADYVEATAEALGSPFAAHLLIGADQICDFVSGAIDGADEELRDLVESAQPLSAWDALGVGYSKKLDPIGRVAIGYEDAAFAEADLDGRRLLAAEGPSLVRNEPLSDIVFTLEDAQVNDGVIELESNRETAGRGRL